MKDISMSDKIQQIAARLRNSRFAVAFTGAGISTESGIPDFRSPGGIWSQSTPVMFNDFMSDAEARYEYWRQKAIAHRDFADSKPNVGHQILAKWEKQQRLQAVITQNIDGLHQEAGCHEVAELHGTAREIACMDCTARFPANPLVAQFLADDAVPACSVCGSRRLKHATISFGQSLEEAVMERTVAWAEQCDLLFAMGSSLVVHPAAGIPQLAKRAGALLVIINRDPTPQDNTADFVIHESIGATLQAIDEACEG